MLGGKSNPLPETPIRIQFRAEFWQGWYWWGLDIQSPSTGYWSQSSEFRIIQFWILEFGFRIESQGYLGIKNWGI
jgi:hypothetical protein